MEALVLDSRLSTKQSQTIALLSTGKTITDTSIELGIDRKTIYRYMENPIFKKELDRYIDNNVSLLMLGAITELSDIISNSLSDNVKLKAIDLLVKMKINADNSAPVEDVKNLDRGKSIDEILIELETL